MSTAHAWVAHLRTGGTVPWAAFHRSADGPIGRAPTGDRLLPGAQQLELLRRLNLAGPPTPALVERVLGASAPGRGRPDLELVGAVERLPFGPAPVDPADLPDEELLRVATLLLAEDLVARGAPVRPTPAARSLPTLLRRSSRYRLVGDPWLTDPLRARLIRQGRPPGGRRPTVYVLGRRLDAMLLDAWTDRAFTGGGPGWSDWLVTVLRRDRVPPRVDLLAAARRWEQRVGRARTHLVLDPTLLAPLLGVRRPLPTPPSPTFAGVDLARRVAGPLGHLVTPATRADLLRGRLLPRLPLGPGPGPALDEHTLTWAQDRAAAMRRAAVRAGYSVHGDPASLEPLEPTGTHPEGRDTSPSTAGVLDLALRLLLAGPGQDREVGR